MSRHIVVTGATRGLGRAMVEGFANAGHTVSGCGRNAAAIEELQNTYPGQHFSVVDVSNAAAVNAWADAIAPPDLLVNNASVMNRPAPLWETTPEEFEHIVRININGVHHVIHAFVPGMIAQGSGIIVNFSSGWGRSTARDVAPYCTTKWAIEGLSQAMAQEVPPRLAVVALNPGIIDTDMLRTCWAESAAGFPDATTWAQQAVPFILGIGRQHNGQALTCP